MLNLEETNFEMKRRQGEEEPARHIFLVDAVLRNHQFTLEEVNFLKQINLESVVSRNTWGVLHEALVREALTNLKEDTMVTTVQSKTFPLIAADWRPQLRSVFDLTNRKITSTKQWELSEFFPSLKTLTPGQETVKVTDCTYPGAKKPLRLLSSLFCLNIAGQNHISIFFAELIMEALNGQAVDWPAEFYEEFMEEIIKLHRKHSQTMVRVTRTTIGPHLTLLIKAAGVMNVPQEIEAGFRKAKPSAPPEPTTQPKKGKYTKAPPPPPTLHSTVRVAQPGPDKAKDPSTCATPPVSETPRSMVIETEEPWQAPEAVPNIVRQVKQVHRRLENLLATLANKAPPRLLRELDSQFYKTQREATLHKDT